VPAACGLNNSYDYQNITFTPNTNIFSPLLDLTSNDDSKMLYKFNEVLTLSEEEEIEEIVGYMFQILSLSLSLVKERHKILPSHLVLVLEGNY